MNEQTKLSMSELESYRNQQGKQAGKYLRYYCPIHGGDHQRSLTVNPGNGHFICFTCGTWGYLEEKKQEWVEQKKQENDWKYQKPPGNFGEKKVVSNPPTVTPPPPVPEPSASKELSDVLIELQKALPKSSGEKYLEKRKIPLNIALKYGAGYAAYGKWPHTKDNRPVRQWKLGRIVLPHTNPQGEVVNLYGRAVECSEPVPKEYKHDHLPGSKGVFNAKALLSETVFICEGCFNALSLITAGHKEACAIFGIFGLRWEWVQSKRIVFCLDQDKAGENWRTLAWEAVMRGKEVFWLPPQVYGKHKDLNEVWMATGKLDIGDWQETATSSHLHSQDWQNELETWPPDLKEIWQERAAIRYFDGGLSKEGAERLAFDDVKRQIM